MILSWAISVSLKRQAVANWHHLSPCGLDYFFTSLIPLGAASLLQQNTWIWPKKCAYSFPKSKNSRVAVYLWMYCFLSQTVCLFGLYATDKHRSSHHAAHNCAVHSRGRSFPELRCCAVAAQRMEAHKLHVGGVQGSIPPLVWAL